MTILASTLLRHIRPRVSSSGHASVLDQVRVVVHKRTMASVVDAIPHMTRTATDPRQTGLYKVTVSKVDQVNAKIRLIQLALPKDGVNHFRFLPT